MTKGFRGCFSQNLVSRHTVKKLIRIDPFVSFGRATVTTRPVSTQAIVSRIDAGEEIEYVSHDYDITKEEVEAAIYYETA